MDTKALRQKILDLAIRGQLVPQDPSDEPASVLLERIRAEKQQMVKDGKLKAKDIKNDTVIFVGEDNLHYEKFQDGSIKCIEDEIPFELPEGWCWVRLGVLAQYKKGPFGSSITKAMFVPDSTDAIKVYEQKNAINKDATLGTYFISNEKYNELKSFEVFPDDIIVSCAGTIGETFVLPMDMRKGIINQALMKISLYDLSILDFYLMYFDFQLKSAAQEQGHGIALKNIPPFDILKKYLVPIPPLQEQRRMMKKLHYLLSMVDSIDVDSTAISSLVNTTKSKILDLAIRGKLVPQDPNDEPASVLLERIRAEKEELIRAGKLKRDKKESIIFKGDDNSYYEKVGENISGYTVDELPLGWTIASFSQVNMFNAEALDPSRFPDDMFELYSVPNFDLKEPEIVKGQEIGSTKQIIHEEDVLVCKINPRINRVWIAGHITSHCILGSSEWMVFRNKMLYAPYIQYYFSSPYFRDLLLSNVSGVGGSLMRAQPESVKKYPILLPPYQEQIRISEHVGKLFLLLSTIEKSLN